MYQELLRRVAVESARHRVEQLLIPQRAGGRAMSAADDVVGEDLEDRDRIGAGLRGKEHGPALLIAPGTVRCWLDADLPVADRLGPIVERGEDDEVPLRATA